MTLIALLTKQIIEGMGVNLNQKRISLLEAKIFKFEHFNIREG